MMDDRERFLMRRCWLFWCPFSSIGFVASAGYFHALGTAAASLLSLAIWSLWRNRRPDIVVSVVCMLSVLLGLLV